MSIFTKKHFHIWGKIEGDYQYCQGCGVARAAPCKHQWEVTGESSQSFLGNVYSIRQILKCQKCGELKSFKIGE